MSLSGLRAWLSRWVEVFKDKRIVEMGNRRALLVGCNYPGTKAELHGCINDVNRMRECLVKHYGFHGHNVKLMIDTAKSSEQPTGTNIKKELGRLIDLSKEGDVLFFHYSGHGTRIPAETGDDEDDGYDEAIVPTDLNLLTDDDFRPLFKRITQGVHFTFVSDSCHSGGLIDNEKEQIGPDVKTSGSRGLPTSSTNKDKELPIEMLTELLSQKSGQDVQVGTIRTTLYAMFGEDASSKVKAFVNAIKDKVHNSQDLETESPEKETLAMKFVKQMLSTIEGKLLLQSSEQEKHNMLIAQSGHAGAKPPAAMQVPKDIGCLISGCQSDETSADACPSGDLTKAFGALSNAIQESLTAHKYDKHISNKALVIEVRTRLVVQGYSQHPCLYCSDGNLEAAFILGTSPVTVKSKTSAE